MLPVVDLVEELEEDLVAESCGDLLDVHPDQADCGVLVLAVGGG